MNIQFLPKYSVEWTSRAIYYQQAQLLNHVGEDACQFCRFVTSRPPYGDLDFATCSQAHKCQRGALPFILMECLNEDEITTALMPGSETDLCYESVHFLRQVKVKSCPRYVQFVVSHLTGYTCNSLCAYYLDRVAKKQLALACGKSKGCANNSSFFNLLVPSNATLRAEYEEDMQRDNDENE